MRKYNQQQIIEVFNRCKNGTELLEAREILEEFQQIPLQALQIYNVNMDFHMTVNQL